MDSYCSSATSKRSASRRHQTIAVNETQGAQRRLSETGTAQNLVLSFPSPGGRWALVTLFIALTTQASAGFHTALFLTPVLDMPVKPQTWFTDEPIRHQVSYPAPGGASVAEVYRIPDGKPPAMALLSLGVYDEGFDGEIIVNLGNALARAGYVVVYQWSPEMGMGYRIESSEGQNLVSAFQF